MTLNYFPQISRTIRRCKALICFRNGICSLVFRVAGLLELQFKLREDGVWPAVDIASGMWEAQLLLPLALSPIRQTLESCLS